ncbi:ATG10 Ubiquitin-like-conjugating enzyme ATG10 [Candida maltosa Xu316]|uniref:Autophagy-related protein 10 n=1 Tax=Candida maltosa (strain Xu316) TaxID=1245528 RepID=M3HS27_CANMX|nr:Autophagy-related protein 10 [Candida maltosa Xu316]
MITNQEFNKNLDEFLLILLDNLSLDGIEYHVLNHYSKSVFGDKQYAFFSISVSCLRLDCTISYDDLYTVPVINIRLYNNDKLLMDPNSQTILKTNTSVIQLQNHHLLQEPWLQIHPCETLETIDTHLRNVPESKKYNDTLTYLCCWFGIYGLPTMFPQFSFRPHVY